jgi:hypothetical protein
MKQIHIILIATLFSFIGLSSFITIKQEVYDNTTSNKGDEEDIIIGKIYKLREVQEHEKYLQKVAGPKSHISFIVAEKPSKKIPFYEIQVGYNGPDRFETYFFFRINHKYINEKNIEPYVDILDPISSNYINLLKWRKIRI